MPQTDRPERPTAPPTTTSTTRTSTPVYGYKAPIGGAASPDVRQGTPGLRTGDQVYDPETGTLRVSPGYFEGDEWMFAGKPPEDVADVQMMLIKAGLLSEDIPIGAWDERSAKAFAKILETANRTGVDWGTALMQYADKPTLKDLMGGSGRAPLTVRLSNPDDLKEAFRQVAYNTLGGKFVDDQQAQHFVDAYHQMEASYQRAAYSSAASGGTVTEAPQADTAALEQLKAEDPAGYQAAQFANYGRLLRDTLMGGGQ